MLPARGRRNPVSPGTVLHQPPGCTTYVFVIPARPVMTAVIPYTLTTRSPRAGRTGGAALPAAAGPAHHRHPTRTEQPPPTPARKAHLGRARYERAISAEPVDPILVPARVGAGNGQANEPSFTVPPTHLLWLISAADRRDHAVTISDIEAGLVAGRGTYQSICGHTVYTCSMLTPPGTPCPACRERLAVPRKRRHRRNRRWWPLCTLCSRTASVSGGDPEREGSFTPPTGPGDDYGPLTGSRCSEGRRPGCGR